MHLIPEIHSAGLETSPYHNLFGNHEDNTLYSGKVRPVSLSNYTPETTSVVNIVINEIKEGDKPNLSTTSETMTNSTQPVKNKRNVYNDSTAFLITISIGIALVVMNLIIFVCMCYHRGQNRGKRKKSHEKEVVSNSSSDQDEMVISQNISIKSNSVAGILKRHSLTGPLPILDTMITDLDRVSTLDNGTPGKKIRFSEPIHQSSSTIPMLESHENMYIDSACPQHSTKPLSTLID